MPGDLLRYLGGPTGFAWWWWVVAGLSAAAVVSFYAGLFVWTLPAARLRRIPVLRSMHRRLLRRRFTVALAGIAGRHRSGQLPLEAAAAALSRTLRSFLAVSTGARVQYMHIKDLTAHHELGSVAPVFAALDDAQFSPARGDIGQLIHATTEVVAQWS